MRHLTGILNYCHEKVPFGKVEAINGNIRTTMLVQDPPDHTRRRTFISKAFTLRAIEGLRGQIQDMVETLLDAVAGRGGMELIVDLSYPLPARIICEMLDCH